MVYCSVVDADVVRVEVDSPYFSGPTVAWCFDNPSYDLIMGNIEGVRRTDDLDKWWIMANGTIQQCKLVANRRNRVNREIYTEHFCHSNSAVRPY